MEKIREVLKKNKMIFKIWNIFYQRKLKKIEKAKLKGNYKFINKSTSSENLCIVLAGYKEFLWEETFKRIKKFTPKDFDVCIISCGLYSTKLSELCEENKWSYLSLEQNKVTLAQNIAINLHSNAKYIYKLDEDMFITKDFFEKLKETYIKVKEEEIYKPGFIAPLININGYGYRKVLEKTNTLSEFEKKFGIAYMDATPRQPIIDNSEIARFLWGDGNDILKDIDEVSGKFSKDPFLYSICPIRFSIGAIMFPRTTWEEMNMFNVTRGNNMALDEVQLCSFCTIASRPMIVSENVLVGHFSYGPQTSEMKKYYQENKKVFLLKE